MKSDQRKAQRRLVRYPAWIDAGGSRFDQCTLTNASDTGARLAVDFPEVVPEQFNLRLSTLGNCGRQSRVVWRSESEIGVVFDTQKPAPARK